MILKSTLWPQCPPSATMEPRVAFTATLDHPETHDQPTILLGVCIPHGYNGNHQNGWLSILWLPPWTTNKHHCKGLRPLIFERFCWFAMLQQQQCVAMSKYAQIHFVGCLSVGYTHFFIKSNEDNNNGCWKRATKIFQDSFLLVICKHT